MEKIIVIYIRKEKLIFLLYKDPLEIRKKKKKQDPKNMNMQFTK